jgi:SAM-dependent methyltransferase
MDESEVKRHWEQNAEAWTALSRAGYDVYRDVVNIPAFLNMLPDVNGLAGLDVGCGEGHNTRLVAQRGARMMGIDISDTFVRHAHARETEQALGISYLAMSGQKMDFPDGTFDFCMATMSLMDMANPAQAMAEAYRVIKPGGFFQFSISHPCFATPKWQWQKDGNGRKTALLCGDYFVRLNGDIDQWIFSAAPVQEKNKYQPFQIPRFTMILSDWVNSLIKTGFQIEEFCEPCPDAVTARQYPGIADAAIVAYFLIIRCRKP